MPNTTSNTSNQLSRSIGSTLPRAQFDVALMKVDAEAGGQAFSANFSQVAGMEWEMPCIHVGACVLLEATSGAAYLGIATEVSAPGKHPQFSAHFFPLVTSKKISKRRPDYIGGLPMLTARYLVEVVSDDVVCRGSFSKLTPADAEHVLAQIAPWAPAELLEVFWSESEIAAIAADFAAQERYTENANALLQSL